MTPSASARDDERGEPALARAFVGRREDDDPGRVPRVRDEHLRAVDDVLVAVALSSRLDARDVGAGVRLGERERAEERLFEQRRQPLLLLLVGAGEQDRRRPECVGDERDRDPRTAPGELLADQDPVEDREAGPAELLRDVDVHQAELVRLRDHVRRVRLMLVVLGGDRADLLLGELVRQRAQVALLVGQGERDPACSGLFGDRHRGSACGSMVSARCIDSREWTSSSQTSSA